MLRAVMYTPLNGDQLLDHALAQMIGVINRKTSVFRGTLDPEPEEPGEGEIVVDGKVVPRDKCIDPTQGSHSEIRIKHDPLLTAIVDASRSSMPSGWTR